MAAAKKKAPAKKQKTPVTKKPKVQVKAKTAAITKAKAEVKKKIAKVKVAATAKPKPKVKTSATKKAKVQVKAKAKAVKITAKTKAKKVTKQTTPKKALKAKVQVKAKAKKIVAMKKALPQKNAVTAKKSAVPKKGTAAVAPAADRFRGLKSMLIAKRDALLNEAKQEIQKYVSGENRQLVDTAIDEADWAAVEISEDINLKRLGAQRQLLKDVEECLRKINEGTYGICEDCGEEISEKRLHVIPTASLCIDCKEQREKMAILDQDTEI